MIGLLVLLHASNVFVWIFKHKLTIRHSQSSSPLFCQHFSLTFTAPFNGVRIFLMSMSKMLIHFFCCSHHWHFSQDIQTHILMLQCHADLRGWDLCNSDFCMTFELLFSNFLCICPGRCKLLFQKANTCFMEMWEPIVPFFGRGEAVLVTCCWKADRRCCTMQQDLSWPETTLFIHSWLPRKQAPNHSPWPACYQTSKQTIGLAGKSWNAGCWWFRWSPVLTKQSSHFMNLISTTYDVVTGTSKGRRLL